MSMIKSNTKGAQPTPFMAEFQPLRTLWEGTNAPYPSEHSARWEVRKLRDELARSQAMAMHRGRLLYHPARFEAVAQKAAIEQFANRALGGAHD
jgi:hypothetical protein